MKDLVVLVRLFDFKIMKDVTRFIDLPSITNGSAAAIFSKIDECLTSFVLRYENLICFNSDTCNIMKGHRNGVIRYLQEKQPNILDLGCICHLENSCNKVTINVDSLLVDINRLPAKFNYLTAYT